MPTLDPQKYFVTFAGLTIQGFADGEFVKIAFSEDAYMDQVGGDGEGARILNRNKSADVTLTLMQTSLSNDALSALAAADRLNGGGSGPLMVKDANGSTVAQAEQAWVKKLPDTALGKELGTREWVLRTTHLEMVVGGNA